MRVSRALAVMVFGLSGQLPANRDRPTGLRSRASG